MTRIFLVVSDDLVAMGPFDVSALVYFACSKAQSGHPHFCSTVTPLMRSFAGGISF